MYIGKVSGQVVSIVVLVVKQLPWEGEGTHNAQ